MDPLVYEYYVILFLTFDVLKNPCLSFTQAANAGMMAEKRLWLTVGASVSLTSLTRFLPSFANVVVIQEAVLTTEDGLRCHDSVKYLYADCDPSSVMVRKLETRNLHAFGFVTLHQILIV